MKITDQTGYSFEWTKNPERILSTVPSITETLFDLGLDTQLSGITRFCTHPPGKVNKIPRIGGTKSLNIGKIVELNPDLIIAGKEENQKEQIEWLRERYPVYLSDIITLEHVLLFISDLGILTSRIREASELISQIKNGMKVSPNNAYWKQKKVLYLIWKNPYMAAARETFIDSMLSWAGLKNVCSGWTRYPTLPLSEIYKLKPDIILLSTEPYPFSLKDVQEIEVLFPGVPVRIVSGRYFSWYGSALLEAFPYINQQRKEWA